MTGCVDKAGVADRPANIAALANDVQRAAAGPRRSRSPRAPRTARVIVGQPSATFSSTSVNQYSSPNTPRASTACTWCPATCPRHGKSRSLKSRPRPKPGSCSTGRRSSRVATSSPRTRPRPDPEGDSGNYVQNGSNDVRDGPDAEGGRRPGRRPRSVVWTLLARLLHGQHARAGRRHGERHLARDAVPAVRGGRHQRGREAYLDAVGDGNEVSWGAQAWQAAIAFQQVVNQIVQDQGPNAITRANLLAGLEGLDDFTADGWSGAKSLRGLSPCFVLMQIQDGEFVRGLPRGAGNDGLRRGQHRRGHHRTGVRSRSAQLNFLEERIPMEPMGSASQWCRRSRLHCVAHDRNGQTAPTVGGLSRSRGVNPLSERKLTRV